MTNPSKMDFLESEMVGEKMNSMLREASENCPKAPMEEFEKVKQDDLRIDAILKMDHVHELVNITPTFPKKSAEESAKFKENGNNFFKKKSYVSAMEEYNKAVLMAPTEEEGTKDLALAFGNRSAALYHLKRAELCIRDCHNAVENGFPKENKYKLYDRIGKSYILLKDQENAVTYFEKAQEALKASKLDEKALKTWGNNLGKQLKWCNEKMLHSPIKSSGKSVPKKNGGRNSKYPCASVGVEIKYNEKRGRHAVATANIHVGDVLMVEHPFTSILLEKFYVNHCYHCTKQCLNLVPCIKCNNHGYCSKECREQSWEEYHKKEHPYIDLLGYAYCAKIGHICLRLLLNMGYKALMKYYKEHKDKEEEDPLNRGCNEDGVYSDEYHAIYNLETNLKERIPNGLFDFGVMSIYLLKVIQKMGFFACTDDVEEDTKYSQELVDVGTVFMKQLQFIQCNAYGIKELQFPSNLDENGPADVGMGLYPTAALLNHSCDPNADQNFFNNVQIVRATRNIKKGEEICIDYGQLFYKIPKRARNYNLMFRYCFNCECPACKYNWGLARDMESRIPVFQCDKCRKELIMTSKTDQTAVRCDRSRCHNTVNVKEAMERLKNSHDRYNFAMENAISARYDVALPEFEDHLTLMQTFLLPPWRDLTACQAAIRECYRMKANVRDC